MCCVVLPGALCGSICGNVVGAEGAAALAASLAGTTLLKSLLYVPGPRPRAYAHVPGRRTSTDSCACCLGKPTCTMISRFDNSYSDSMLRLFLWFCWCFRVCCCLWPWLLRLLLWLITAPFVAAAAARKQPWAKQLGQRRCGGHCRRSAPRVRYSQSRVRARRCPGTVILCAVLLLPQLHHVHLVTCTIFACRWVLLQPERKQSRRCGGVGPGRSLPRGAPAAAH